MLQSNWSYDRVNHIHMDGIYNIEDTGDQRMDVYMDSSLLMIDIFITAICLIHLCYVVFHNDTHAEITMLLHMDNCLFMAHFSHHSYDLKWQNSWITQKWDSAHMKVSWSIVWYPSILHIILKSSDVWLRPLDGTLCAYLPHTPNK